MTANVRVLIIGAGPTGLFLRSELARFGISHRIVDARSCRQQACKALNVSWRTLEIFEHVFPERPFASYSLPMQGAKIWTKGQPVQTHTIPSLEEYGTHIRYPSIAPQYITEAYIEDNGSLIQESAPVEWNHKVTSIQQDQDFVDVTIESTSGNGISEVETIKADWVIGCDGAHSICRKSIGAQFSGFSSPEVFMLGDVLVSIPTEIMPPKRTALRFQDGLSFQMWIPLTHTDEANNGLRRFRISGFTPEKFLIGSDNDPTIEHGFLNRSPPTMLEMQEWIDDAAPPMRGVKIQSLLWSSFYRVSNRISDKYSSGRVIIVGDAAHIHTPKGGLGMNTGLQDSFALGWRLAQAVKRGLPSNHDLILEYARERHKIGVELVEEKSKDMSKKENATSRPLLQLQFDSQLFIQYDPRAESGEPISDLISVGRRLPDSLQARMPHGESRTESYKVIGDKIALQQFKKQMNIPVELIQIEERPSLIPNPSVLLLVRPDQHVVFIGTSSDLTKFIKENEQSL